MSVQATNAPAPQPNSTQEKRPIRVAIITVSDRAYQGIYKDESGPKVAATFPAEQYDVVATKIVPDEIVAISNEIVRCVEMERVDVVVTTGGTGCSIRDVTPEATRNVIQREVVGISEVIRLANREKNPNMILSRGVSGIRNQTLVFNLPGNPENARMALESVLAALPHCIKTMRQQRPMRRHGGQHSVGGPRNSGDGKPRTATKPRMRP
ncbi:MAG: MogA/MoaB family molybdenum cofactor biosynthesis protein [Chloroherpetonaceae bacterium]